MLSRALTRHLLQRSQEVVRASSCASASSCRLQHTQASEEEDTEEFRELVRDFAAREVAPHAADIDRNNALPTHKNLWTEMGHMGLHGEGGFGSEESSACHTFLSPVAWKHINLLMFVADARLNICCAGITVPADYGGLNMGYQHHCIAMEVGFTLVLLSSSGASVIFSPPALLCG